MRTQVPILYTEEVRASERAYSTLRDEILAWTLPPGTLLNEVEQSERLGVSRTPLRSALTRLTAEGLLVSAGRGTMVSPVSLDGVHELFEARDALEQKMARLAARDRDPLIFEGLARELGAAHGLVADIDPGRSAYYALVAKFDAAVDEACCNSYLVAAAKSIRGHLARIRRLASDNPARLQAAAAEHRLIADAIARGDEELAAAATRVHLHRSLQNILDTTGDAIPVSVRPIDRSTRRRSSVA